MTLRPAGITLALIAVAATAHAQESRWVEIGGNGQVTVSFDTQSVRRTGPRVKVWLRWIHASPVDRDAVYPKKTYLSAKTLDVYHCTDRTATVLQEIRYADADTSGEVVETISVPEAIANYQEVAPETIGEDILIYVCNNTPSNKK